CVIRSAIIAFVFAVIDVGQFWGSAPPRNCTGLPYRGTVWLNKLYVPPYKLLSAIISSPAFATFKIAKVMAAIPDAVATAAVPSSNKATRFSNVSTVGFIIRE